MTVYISPNLLHGVNNYPQAPIVSGLRVVDPVGASFPSRRLPLSADLSKVTVASEIAESITRVSVGSNGDIRGDATHLIT